jgi:hypothetical protein
MIACHVPREILENAASKVGVVAEIRPIGRRFNVKLFPMVTADMLTPSGRRRAGDQGDAKYQRESVGMSAGRRVNAVCWHGFRDYFRAVFAETPDAIFRTAVAVWNGSEDFEARFPETGHRNIGSQAFPQMMADACRCPERGYAH